MTVGLFESHAIQESLPTSRSAGADFGSCVDEIEETPCP